MYTGEQLGRYPFFQKLLEETSLEVILDPLTGVVSRGYILDFAKSLIAEGTPFTFAIIDLDNFKFINDTYGHKIGDVVLSDVADKLIAYLGERGVAGRFGGDEFLFIDLVDHTYEDKKAFMVGLYAGNVLRRNIVMESCSPFVTATTGCASFPDDATDYDGLFNLIDKTLYRGKTKGRNCHIIYVEEKHKNIEIKQLARHGVCTAMHNLIRQFELVPTLSNKLYSVLPFLMDELNISDLYVINKTGHMFAVKDKTFSEQVPDIHALVSDDFFTSNRLEDIQNRCPEFYEVLKRHEMETIAMVRIGMDFETDGYLICAEPRSKRIWQEDECAILYFLAKLIAARIRIDHETLEPRS